MKVIKNIALILIACSSLNSGFSQKAVNFELPDGTNVMLVPGKNYDKKDLYYYLPTNFRTSTNENDMPEFSLMYYTEEKTEEAILHLIIKWGLTEEQLTLTENMLNEVNESPALIMGAVSLNNGKEFTISQNTKLGIILKQSLTSSSQPPLMPGTKMALSFKINVEDTKAIKTLLENKTELEQTFFSFYFEDVNTSASNKTLIFNISFKNFYHLNNK